MAVVGRGLKYLLENISFCRIMAMRGIDEMNNAKEMLQESFEEYTKVEDLNKKEKQVEYRKLKARYEDYQQRRKKGVHIWMGIFSAVMATLAAIFFYLYNKTITSMSNYHNKLVLSQNISIALKVADTLPSDDKVKAKNTIINELLKDVNSYLIQNDSSSEKSE